MPGHAGPWLVVIDMQQAFAAPASPWFLPSFAETAERVAALLPRFGPRVLFTRFVPPARIAGSWAAYYRKWPFAAAAGRGDPIWAIAPPFRPARTLDTHQFSKWTPALRDLVGGDAMIALCGVSTDCCVLATALAAIEDGTTVRVVADACGARTPALHRAALDLLRLRAPQVIVSSVAEEQVP